MATIKVRTQVEGDRVHVKLLVKHPMETGRRVDPDTGKRIPTRAIQELTCRHNDKSVLNCQMGSGISKNPFLSFEFAGGRRGDALTVTWVDNLGDSDSLTVRIK